jgi:hypothetical protein
MKLLIDNDCDVSLNAEKILFEKLFNVSDCVNERGMERRDETKLFNANDWTAVLSHFSSSPVKLLIAND